MLFVNQRIDCVSDEQQVQSPQQVFECQCVELLGLRLGVGIFVGDADGNEAEIGRLLIHFAVDHLVNLPYLNAQTDEGADVNQRVRLVVQHVQQL